ncbi:MAG: putative aminoglycoside phosphotransferase [Subtercola sp.]|nr:putative aminoglycoside phosphotransferase [Subtercola sp.]
MSTVIKAVDAIDFLDGESLHVSQLRDRPSEEFIEFVRDAFPTEREYDSMLTRKLRRRSSTGRHVQYDLGEMSGFLSVFLQHHQGGDFSISDERWLLGGASKIQFGFTLHRADGTPTRMVIRMEPRESLNATSRNREFELLTAMRGVVPVPDTYWVDADGEWFPEPALIYAFAEGVSRPTDSAFRVSGAGQNFGPTLRARLAEQFMEHLALIHTYDWSSAKLPSFTIPRAASTDSALWQLNRARRVWEEDKGEDLPYLDVAARWLEDNLPVLDNPSVVHGDYRAGNFLFNENTQQITAWLDWERGYIGDRHRDLAWTLTRSFGHLAEDQKTFLVSGLVPLPDFLPWYESLTGLAVDHDALRFYRVFDAYQLVVSNLASSYRVAKNGRSHQDALLMWTHGVSSSIASDLLTILDEEIL